jgi:opacity protein-like surface antigen
MFFAEPKTTQKVIVGAEGESRRKGDDDDLAASIGVAFTATDSLTIRVGYERYDIDGNSTDFPSVSAFWAFGGSGD